MSWIGDVWKNLRTSPKLVPAGTAALAYPDGKRVGKSNAYLFRQWAEKSEWVRAAINVRKTQVSSAEWDIVPADPNKNTDNVRMARKIRDLFLTPNPRADSFRSFIEPIIEDILTLDAGVIEKVTNLRQEVKELWGVDGAKIKVSAIWDGDPNEARYFYYPVASISGQEAVPFLNSDMLYIMANPRTYSVVGLAPLETLKEAIDSELAGSDYNRRQVTTAAPDGMLNLGEDVPPEKVEEFQSYWQSEIAGKGAMAIVGGSKNPNFVEFHRSNRDMQFLEWQTYLVRKIAAVFGLTPQDLGITFDVNRSTSEVQAEQTEDRGLRPLLALIQDYLTREVVWDPGFGGAANNLAFRFTSLNLKESTALAQIGKMAGAGVPWRTVNEMRVREGREPLGPQFDNLIMATSVGAVSLADIPTAREAVSKPSTTPPAGK